MNNVFTRPLPKIDLGIVLSLIVMSFFSGGYIVKKYNKTYVTEYTNGVVTDTHNTFTTDNIAIKINEYRIENGLNALYYNSYLKEMAGESLSISCQNGEKISGHDGYRKIIDSGKLSSLYTGEVLYSSDNPTAFGAVESWKQSPTHNSIVIDKKYEYFGVSVIGNCAGVIFGNMSQ